MASKKMATIFAVSMHPTHQLSKETVKSIELIKGEGVVGDTHRGVTVQHRSRVKANPAQPNLRQVHLIHYELIEELRAKGFKVNPATLGENITTQNIDLLSLPTGTVLTIGSTVKIEITGLRNPCSQLDDFQKGLTAAVLDKDVKGNLIRKSGVMAVVLQGGEVKAKDSIQIKHPLKPCQSLECV